MERASQSISVHLFFLANRHLLGLLTASGPHFLPLCPIKFLHCGYWATLWIRPHSVAVDCIFYSSKIHDPYEEEPFTMGIIPLIILLFVLLIFSFQNINFVDQFCIQSGDGTTISKSISKNYLHASIANSLRVDQNQAGLTGASFSGFPCRQISTSPPPRITPTRIEERRLCAALE